MRELYAIDPEALRTPQDLNQVRNWFGFQTGRFIAEYPGSQNTNWIGLIRARLNDCGELERTRLECQLRHIGKGLMPVDALYRKDLPWLHNARAELLEKRVKTSLTSILTIPAVTPKSEYESLTTLHEFTYIHDAHTARAGVIDCTIDSYCSLLEPLLKASTEVTLVDRYLHFISKFDSENYTKLLLELCRMAGPSKRCEKIVIVAGLPSPCRAPAEFKQDLIAGFHKAKQQITNNFRTNTPKLEYLIIDDEELAKKKLHARFCFSAKGAIQLDHGYLIRKSEKNYFQWGNEKLAEDVEDTILQLRNLSRATW